MSKTDMAILGMLTVEPMSGYDMKQFCEASLSHFWYESYGNLYPRLKRLSKEGLIRGRRTSRGRGPESIVYELTPRGRARLREWLLAPPDSERLRSEFMLKIFFGAEVPAEISAQRLLEYQREQKQLRARYKAIEQMLQAALAERQDAAYWLMSLRRGQLLTEARLRWCQECLTMIEKMKTKEDRDD